MVVIFIEQGTANLAILIVRRKKLVRRKKPNFYQIVRRKKPNFYQNPTSFIKTREGIITEIYGKLVKLNLRNMMRLVLIKPLEVRTVWIVAILKPSSPRNQVAEGGGSGSVSF
jgi:hypothetical protein